MRRAKRMPSASQARSFLSKYPPLLASQTSLATEIAAEMTIATRKPPRRFTIFVSEAIATKWRHPSTPMFLTHHRAILSVIDCFIVSLLFFPIQLG